MYKDHEDISILHTDDITSMTSEDFWDCETFSEASFFAFFFLRSFFEIEVVEVVEVIAGSEVSDEVGTVVSESGLGIFSIPYSTRSRERMVSRLSSSTAFHWSIMTDIGIEPPASAGKIEAGTFSANLSKLA